MNFTYSPERLAALEVSLSTDRLSYYVRECGGDLEAAMRMYQLNTNLSAAFYIPLQGIEVAVRNQLNVALSARFGANWYDLSVIKFEARHAEDVNEAVREATKQDANGNDIYPTNGEVVAALRFGFWVGILGRRNENEIWRKSLWNAFPHRGKGNQRQAVHGALDSIRQLRNLVAHHRRILHRNLLADHENILTVAGWVCPHVRDWIEAHRTFDPNMLPVPQATLPNMGLPAMDQIPPATPLASEPQPTLSGRPRLGIATK